MERIFSRTCRWCTLRYADAWRLIIPMNIKKGYDRVKEKIRNVRQDFRAAVNKGTRSRSGQIVQENYDLLTEIWGGSPATTSLPFGIDGETVEDGDDTSEMNDEGVYRPCLLFWNDLTFVVKFCIQFLYPQWQCKGPWNFRGRVYMVKELINSRGCHYFGIRYSKGLL